MGKMDEPIIVVRRSDLFGGGSARDLTFQGTERDPKNIAELERRMAENYRIMRRGDAEENPEYKQLIPYAFLRRGDQFFTYKRLGGGGESRLHGRVSLGVGGHMNQVDGTPDFKRLLSANLSRELNEELRIENSGRKADYRTIGMINDDAAEVGRVHIGILIAITLPAETTVAVRERDKLEGQWRTLDELKDPALYKRTESWSAFVIDILKDM